MSILLTDSLCGDLKKRGGLDDELLERLRLDAGTDAFEMSRILIQLGHLSRDLIGLVYGDAIGYTYINLEKTLFQDSVVKKLPQAVAERLKAIPIYKFGDVITLALTDPIDIAKRRELEQLLGKVDFLFTLPDELDAAIAINYKSARDIDALFKKVNQSELQNITDEQGSKLKSIVKLSDALILLALKEHASDIHIESKEQRCAVRFRIDGVLTEYLSLPVSIGRPLISRYKILSNLDISNKRKPQDGRLKFKTAIKGIDIRVSTLPCIHGESIVLRLLGSLFGGVSLVLNKLDIAESILKQLKHAIERPNGLVLVVGPTGSGKSTTLYSALNHIDSPGIKILTAEDPVEYEIPNFSQSQVDLKAGRSFDVILRSMLRQDPDVILVGEMRDYETAKIASEAALTGHLVLSTLHTNNALQSIIRLLDMGIEPYVVTPSLAGILAQRLVRRICVHCKTEYALSKSSMKQHFHWPKEMELPRFYRGTGCAECKNTGYKGRLGIHEFITITSEMRELIIGKAPYSELMKYALQSGFKDMRFDGFSKALQGLTTIDEVVRVTTQD